MKILVAFDQYGGIVEADTETDVMADGYPKWLRRQDERYRGSVRVVWVDVPDLTQEAVEALFVQDPPTFYGRTA